MVLRKRTTATFSSRGEAEGAGMCGLGRNRLQPKSCQSDLTPEGVITRYLGSWVPVNGVG